MNMNPFKREAVHRIDVDDEAERERLADLTEQLRNVPGMKRRSDEFAPRPAEYSIERVQSFLSQHIEQLDEAETVLADQADAAKEQLADIERRRAVTKVARDAFAETLAKLTPKADEPEQTEEPQS